MIQSHKTYSSGFTLVEVMVAGFILAILVVVATGPFIDALRFQRGAFVTDEMTDNLQAILNVMDKELRTSSNPRLISLSGTTALEFENQFGEQVRYFQSGNSLHKTVDGVLTVYSETEAFLFRQVRFDVSPASDVTPPRVTISLQGDLQGNNATPSSGITLQSTIIPRNR